MPLLLEVEMEGKERHCSLASQVSNQSTGPPTSVTSEQHTSVASGRHTSVASGRPRGISAISCLTTQTRRPRGLSVLSAFTNRSHKTSTYEIVEMPGGAVVLAVDDGESDGSSVIGSDSMFGTNTIGGVTSAPDTVHFDKIIKKEIAHHSPAVGESVTEDDTEIPTVAPVNTVDDEEPLFAFGANNLLQHLYLALASPAVFRLPSLAYKWSSEKGSGFFTAYTAVMVVIALPLCVLEQTLAQFSSLGVITIFRCLPLFAGVGVGMVATCVILMGYSSTVLAWAVQYTFDCLHQDIPWATCPNNNSMCWPGPGPVPSSENSSYLYTPNDFYFLNTVLGMVSTEVEHKEGQWVIAPLVMIQGFLWLSLLSLVTLGEAWRGGTVSKVWSLVTMATLLTLMVTGLEIMQSGVGLGFIFNWSGDELGVPDIWLDALGQIMWSLGPSLGLLISRTSYKRFRDNICKDVYTAMAANMLVALMTCLAVFPYQGKFNLNDSIDKTPGYFFVISSFAVSHLKVPQLGGFLLYLGICKALLDHTQMLASTVVVSVSDLLPVKYRSGTRLFVCKFICCCLGFVFSLSFITNEGIFLMEAVDAYVPWVSALVLGTLEVIGFVYLYGSNNISQHFTLMIRSKPNYFCFVWKFLMLPTFLGLIVWLSVKGVRGPVDWNKLELKASREELYRWVGFSLAMLPLVLVILTSVFLLLHPRLSVRSLLAPRETWGPALVQHQALYTPGILRAKNRAPYLIVQMETDNSDEASGKDWLPYGYFWVPPKSSAPYIMRLSSEDTTTKAKIAKYLQAQNRSNTACRWRVENYNEVDAPTTSEWNLISNVDRSRRYGVTSLAGTGLDRSRTVSSTSISAGLVLRPNNVAGIEAEIQPLGSNSYDNQAYES